MALLRPHDLRRSYVSDNLDAGNDVATVQHRMVEWGVTRPNTPPDPQIVAKAVARAHRMLRSREMLEANKP